MIDANKLGAVVRKELTVVKAMLGLTQQFIDLCEGERGPEIDKLRLIQSRAFERAKALPDAVIARGPFRDEADLYAVVEEEVRFVVAAFDGGGH
jgi:hypothetical protein